MIENTLNFGEKNLGSWISKTNQPLCNEYELRNISPDQFLILHFKITLNKFIADFFSMQEVKSLLDKMVDYQDLIRELLRLLTLNKITEILQRLVSEGISIRNLKVILGTMLEWAQREKDVVLLNEYVRKGLGRYIAHKYSNGSYLIPSIILSAPLEDTIRNAIRYTNSGTYLAIDPEINLQIIEQINKLTTVNNLTPNLAIITQMDIRRYVRSIIEKTYGYLPVLSFQELEGFCEFNNIGVINLA